MISKKGIDLICEFESFSSKPYVDPGTLSEPITIGYGTTIYPNGVKVRMSDEDVTEDEALSFIENYVSEKIEPFLDTLMLNQNQYDSLCSFCYNIGVNGFRNSTLLKRIKGEPGDIKEAFMMWNKSGGKELKGLTKRREKESELFLTPIN